MYLSTSSIQSTNQYTQDLLQCHTSKPLLLLPFSYHHCPYHTSPLQFDHHNCYSQQTTTQHFQLQHTFSSFLLSRISILITITHNLLPSSINFKLDKHNRPFHCNETPICSIIHKLIYNSTNTSNNYLYLVHTHFSYG